MSFKWYLILMGFGTALAWVAWVIIVQGVNPDEAGAIGLIFFYSTLYLAFTGTLSLAGLMYRVGIRKRDEVLSREVKTTFRHAVLLSLIGIGSLWFSAQGLLRWYTLFVLIGSVVLIEYIFLLIQEARR